MVDTYRSRPDLGKLLHFDEKGTDPFEPGSGGCLADDLHRHDTDSLRLLRVVQGYQETVVLYFHHGPGRDIFPGLPFRFCGDEHRQLHRFDPQLPYPPEYALGRSHVLRFHFPEKTDSWGFDRAYRSAYADP